MILAFEKNAAVQQIEFSKSLRVFIAYSYILWRKLLEQRADLEAMGRMKDWGRGRRLSV